VDCKRNAKYVHRRYNHHVVLQNLTLNTRYYYICGDVQGGFSDEFSFVTAIAQPRPFIVNIYGDMGLTDGENTRTQVINQLSDVDFVWHVGDMSYVDDDILGWQYEEVWDEFMNQIQPITSVRPYMVLPGNHEAECHFLGCLPFSKTFYTLRNFTAYRHRFRMPCDESGGTENMWYSFNYGQAHFVSISTETDFPGSPEGQGSLANDGPFGDQLGWLEADLARADSPAERAVRPWVFVSGHRPIYSLTCMDSSQKPSGECKSCRPPSRASCTSIMWTSSSRAMCIPTNARFRYIKACRLRVVLSTLSTAQQATSRATRV